MAFTYATEQEETLPAADTEQVQGRPVPNQSSPASLSLPIPTRPEKLTYCKTGEKASRRGHK